MSSVFDADEVKHATNHHKHSTFFSMFFWVILNCGIVYVLLEQSDKAQRQFLQFEIVITLTAVFNIYINSKLPAKLAELKAQESAKTQKPHDLAQTFATFYQDLYSKKTKVNFCLFLAMGLSEPDLLPSAFKGQLSWEDVAAYMLFLAFLGTISMMVVMSLNFPFMFHTVTYTFMGANNAYNWHKERGLFTNLQKWAATIPQDEAIQQIQQFPQQQQQQQKTIVTMPVPIRQTRMPMIARPGYRVPMIVQPVIRQPMIVQPVIRQPTIVQTQQEPLIPLIAKSSPSGRMIQNDQTSINAGCNDLESFVQSLKNQ